MLVDRRGGSGPFDQRCGRPATAREKVPFCLWAEEQEACVSGASTVTEALDQFAKQGAASSAAFRFQVPSRDCRNRCRNLKSAALASGGDHERSDAAFNGAGSKSLRQGLSRLLRGLF